MGWDYPSFIQLLFVVTIKVETMQNAGEPRRAAVPGKREPERAAAVGPGEREPGDAAAASPGGVLWGQQQLH